MTSRQQAFAAEYLVDLNATKAAIRAGYSAHTAAEQAHVLMKMPDVAAAIESGIEQRLARVNIKQDDVLHTMSLLSHSSINHYVIDDDGQVSLVEGAPEGAMAAVQSIKRRKTTRTDKDGNVITTVDVELKLWDKVTPLRLMGRHIGLFPDRIEHSGPNGGPVETITEIHRVILDAPFGALANDTERERAIAAQERKLLEG